PRKPTKAALRRAAACLDRAARLGQIDAMCELGYCLVYGEGVRKDCRRAAPLYRRAADAGYDSAMFNLGMCYKQGRGVPRSIAKAVEWWLRAARLGCDRSLEHLAEAYAFGPPSLRDPARARYYARRDAAQKASSAAFDEQFRSRIARRKARAARHA
ncbi:MAG TPA: tetratricopeptide repeat protein, partial [Planctomycetota bacterium]|nr:tetratricopeptide repeat protein [Planctomycetota bacterium]